MRKRKHEPTEEETQELRDRFKGDPDAFFAGGDDASVGSRRRTRKRERYAARLADGFGMLDSDNDMEDIDDDDDT